MKARVLEGAQLLNITVDLQPLLDPSLPTVSLPFWSVTGVRNTWSIFPRYVRVYYYAAHVKLLSPNQSDSKCGSSQNAVRNNISTISKDISISGRKLVLSSCLGDDTVQFLLIRYFKNLLI